MSVLVDFLIDLAATVIQFVGDLIRACFSRAPPQQQGAPRRDFRQALAARRAARAKPDRRDA